MASAGPRSRAAEIVAGTENKADIKPKDGVLDRRTTKEDKGKAVTEFVFHPADTQTTAFTINPATKVVNPNPFTHTYSQVEAHGTAGSARYELQAETLKVDDKDRLIVSGKVTGTLTPGQSRPPQPVSIKADLKDPFVFSASTEAPFGFESLGIDYAFSLLGGTRLPSDFSQSPGDPGALAVGTALVFTARVAPGEIADPDAFWSAVGGAVDLFTLRITSDSNHQVDADLTYGTSTSDFVLDLPVDESWVEMTIEGAFGPSGALVAPLLELFTVGFVPAAAASAFTLGSRSEIHLTAPEIIPESGSWMAMLVLGAMVGVARVRRIAVRRRGLLAVISLAGVVLWEPQPRLWAAEVVTGVERIQVEVTRKAASLGLKTASGKDKAVTDFQFHPVDSATTEVSMNPTTGVINPNDFRHNYSVAETHGTKGFANYQLSATPFMDAGKQKFLMGGRVQGEITLGVQKGLPDAATRKVSMAADLRDPMAFGPSSDAQFEFAPDGLDLTFSLLKDTAFPALFASSPLGDGALADETSMRFVGRVSPGEISDPDAFWLSLGSGIDLFTLEITSDADHNIDADLRYGTGTGDFALDFSLPEGDVESLIETAFLPNGALGVDLVGLFRVGFVPSARMSAFTLGQRTVLNLAGREPFVPEARNWVGPLGLLAMPAVAWLRRRCPKH